MTYSNAKKLKPGDKVIEKGYSMSQTVAYIEDFVRTKSVLIYTDEGRIFHHTKVK